jgi:hypothetical protein
MRLPQTILGEHGVVCVFETKVGDSFRVTRPAISKGQEAALMEVLLLELRQPDCGWKYVG